MRRALWHSIAGLSLLLVAASPVAAAQAAAPSAGQALKLKPIQRVVDYDIPGAGEVAQCKIVARKINGHVGWVVEGPGGLTLRMFVDTNGDNVVDRWSYYKDGLEVYRDIDANFNGKADQYRWFNTGGSRWGLDKNEDGIVDAWKVISAEEVTAEVVAALATGSTDRFTPLALTTSELTSLGLGKEKSQALASKIGRIAAEFKALAAQQKAVTSESKWLQFSATMPGIVPAGTDGLKRDLRVYENVAAIVQTGDTHGQVQIGTLVQIGNVWRLIDVPKMVADNQAELSASGFFFRTSNAAQGSTTQSGPSEAAQKLLADLESLDQAAAAATTPQQQAQFNARRADLLEQIARQSTSPQDRAMWMRQLADMVSAAVQSGTYPGGAKRLETLFEQLRKSPADKELAPYVKFRQLTADYGLKLQSPKADFAKIQTEWLESLQKYVADYPTSDDAAEAMLQLGIAEEFAGEEGKAEVWYARIVKDFASSSSAAKKAAGARARLGSVGKTIAFSGRSTSGAAVDLAQYRGKVVLIQYWATWCEPCKRDLPMLKELTAKYGRSFGVIGVSLDGSRQDLTGYLAENPLPWPQIFEEGGLDSRPANQLGILTLPTMILVDKQGKVVDRNVQIGGLAEKLKALVAQKASSGRLAGRRAGSR